MRLLSGPDAFHLLEETPDQHMHTMKIVVVDAAAARSPVTLPSVRSWVGERALRIPALRWRPAPIPLGLGRPLAVDVAGLDLGYHVRETRAPVPGGDADLDQVVSSIASTPLDRDKPLWQLWVVGGLAGDRVAFVFKMHHAIADGGASVRILEELFGVDEPPDAAPPPGERLPAAPVRMLLAVRTQLVLLTCLPRQLRRTAAFLAGAARHVRAGGPKGTEPFTGPATRFNRPLTPRRSYVSVTVPLDELRRAKDAFGGTLNDVFIALCGGALRRYLAARGELPDAPLTAASPVSIREEAAADYGNHISYWYVSLGTDVAEPAARVAAVRESTAAARAVAQRDRGFFTSWMDHYLLSRLVTVTGVAVVERLRGRPSFNAIVSNVRGPRPLTYDGAPVVAVRSMGPLVGLQGLNFTAWSYGADVAIGIHTCRDHADDVRDFSRHVVDELRAFAAAAGAPAADLVRAGA